MEAEKKEILALIAGNSFAQLVGVRSTADKKNVPPFLRVKPGSPDSSFLFIKIIAPDTNQGEMMPKGTDQTHTKQHRCNTPMDSQRRPE